ncbi:sensor histidine kinase [Ferruginibacter sp. HRS2-29]|uniref:sensor histidine kinase n=1 Tax=Ferruginibacter sp. HRS2-29 TaxID=2487334 RepID=UPI0020CF7481|nr:sensor histidine kinase [Ferruginibacter sp. HRS2-29]MCP9750712.1 hypothetical protein [Ferruginibacter sp. HRS2-29]
MKKSIIILLHIGYWVLYLLLIYIFATFIRLNAQKAIGNNFNFMLEFFKAMGSLAVLPAVISFYTFYNTLFNRFLARRRIGTLCIAAFITILASGLAGALTINFAQGKFHIRSYDIWPLLQIILFMSVLALIHGIIALVMRGFTHWYNDIRVKEELEQKNLQSELALVKSQLNPHFLFNTINNIDVLIEKDQQKASEYLNKLSDILRFLLYETSAETVPLQKELDYISKYIDLQKIRYSNTNFVQYNVQGNPGNHRIATMLFIPFIENAFKHSVQRKKEASIKIRISITNDTISFFCINHFTDMPLLVEEAGGLGNDLIQKRLSLLYPQKHELSISKETDLYKVQLTIQPG